MSRALGQPALETGLPASRQSRRAAAPGGNFLDAAAGCDARNEQSGGEAAAGGQRSRNRLRAARLFEQRIEFVDSPSFHKPGAAREILGPEPGASGESQPPTAQPPAGTPPYLADLYKVPLLSAHLEYFLFRKMNFLKFRAARLRRRLDRRNPQPELLDEIEQLLAEALQVRNRIVQANLRLVVSIAKTLVDRANPFDDIVSEGNLPLIRAAEIFDFERGTRFSTYATWAIRNGLYRATARNRRYRQRSSVNGEAAFASVPDERTSVLACEQHHQGVRRSVENLLAQLEDQRDRTILTARFGLGDEERPLKFREIAEQLNLSTERVRQLLSRTLKRLREPEGAGDGVGEDCRHVRHCSRRGDAEMGGRGDFL